MAYNLQRTATTLVSGKNILASEHVQFVEAGITLTGGVAYSVGEGIARIVTAGATKGLWVKFVDANVATYDDFGILNVDVPLNSANSIVGEVIIRGSVYDAKLVPATATALLKTKLPMVRFVTHTIA